MTCTMAAFLFAFAAVLVVSVGGRDQLLVAGTRGRWPAVLAVGAAVSLLSALAMAAAAIALTIALPPAAADMLVAFGLVIAAAELAWQKAMPASDTAERSLAAIATLLLARQLGDAARFLVFAFAAGGSAWLAAGGGAAGGTAALAVGLAAGRDICRWPLRPIRLALAVILLTAGIAIGLSTRGIIG